MIFKNKRDIIPTSATAVLESVIDIFNFIQFISKNLIKSKVNLSFANLVKWSDQVLLKSETQTELIDQGLRYISEFKKAVKLMSKSSLKFVQLESESGLVSSLFLTSSSEESEESSSVRRAYYFSQWGHLGLLSYARDYSDRARRQSGYTNNYRTKRSCVDNSINDLNHDDDEIMHQREVRANASPVELIVDECLAAYLQGKSVNLVKGG